MGGLAAAVVVVVLEKAERPGDLRDCRSSNGMDCMTRGKGHGGMDGFFPGDCGICVSGGMNGWEKKE